VKRRDTQIGFVSFEDLNTEQPDRTEVVQERAADLFTWVYAITARVE